MLAAAVGPRSRGPRGGPGARLDQPRPRGAEGDPRRIALLAICPRGFAPGREAVLQAIGRNNRLAASPEILGTIRKLIGRPEAAPSLLPVLKWPVLADAEVVSLLEQAWPRMSQPQRLEAIEVLLGPPCPAGSI